MQDANGPRLGLHSPRLTMNPLNLCLMRLPSAAHSQTVASVRTVFATTLNVAGIAAPMELFDLQAGPAEPRDVAAANPKAVARPRTRHVEIASAATCGSGT